jgi:hypothetical protein
MATGVTPVLRPDQGFEHLAIIGSITRNKAAVHKVMDQPGSTGTDRTGNAANQAPT